MADVILIRKSWEAELEHPLGGRQLFIVEDPRVPQTYFYSTADAEAAVARAGCRWSYDDAAPSW